MKVSDGHPASISPEKPEGAVYHPSSLENDEALGYRVVSLPPHVVRGVCSTIILPSLFGESFPLNSSLLTLS